MLQDANTQQLETLVELLKQTTVLSVVSNFLRSKGLHFSASGWDEMRDKRLKPAFAEGTISLDDLVSLLRDAEESGRQHVFLYQCSASEAEQIMDRDRVRAAAETKGVSSAIDSPLIVEQPSEPTFSEIRWTSATLDLNLIIKSIETRVSRVFVGEENVDGYIVRRYKEERERAVYLAKLHRDGLLEIRIASQKNSASYTDVLSGFMFRLRGLLATEVFSPVSLSKAKDTLWNRRSDLSSEIKYSESTLKNVVGSSLKAATGSPSSNLFSDVGVVSSFENFIGHSAYCESSNIWFLQRSTGVPSKDIHVILSGALNEFAITAACTPQEYDHVLNRLRSFNR